MKKLTAKLSELTTFILLGLIKFYKYVISPHTTRACRYEPSCSSYGLEALQKHGPIYGSYLTLKRILSCNPWGGYGYDPVPEKRKKGNHKHH